MPIREYVCPRCGLEFESIDLGSIGGSVRGSEPTAAVCPGCGSKKVQVLFSSFSTPGDTSSPSCGTESSSNRFR